MAQTILELLGMASGATPPPGDGRQSLTSYEPTMRDKLANWLLGETPSQTKKDFVQGLVGSRGMGATGMGLVDPTSSNILHGIPVGAMIGSGLIMGQDGRPHKIEHMPEGYDPFASQNPENGT